MPPPLEHADARTADAAAVEAFAATFFAALQQSGVQTVCVSPGSRSTPLTVAAARTQGLRVIPIIDERSAGFFALGLARQSGQPVALVCTSGTAAANYLPAVVEAHHARVPLVVLTADRPPELRDWGAGQTIDQVGLYGTRVRRFVELPVPGPGAGMLAYARTLAARAIGDACGANPGPVHLNWPLREPLEPLPSGTLPTWTEGPARAVARVEYPPLYPAPEQVADLVARVKACERGVIVCGPLAPEPGLSDAIAHFAQAAGWPLLADPTAQLRSGPHIEIHAPVRRADLLLRPGPFAQTHRPDLVLRFGDTPVSKAQRLWLEEAEPAQWIVVDASDAWPDPGHLTTQRLRVDPRLLCEALAEALTPFALEREAWPRSFMHASDAIDEVVDAAIAAEPALFEPRAVTELAACLPADVTLYVSNSMPVRDVDAHWPRDARPLRVLCNRGANGIDGVVSSALGAASAGHGHVVLLIGDVALLHDLGALLTGRLEELSLTIVLLNNDGGGIFSFLPIAQHGESVDFERLFRTPHGFDFETAARAYGAGHTRVSDWNGYRQALEEAFASGPEAASRASVQIIEVPIDRDANLAHWQDLVARAGACLAVEASR
jgi:2-succinyl-5-enolpyruvyl-6-hydroxy-3-cyclohexene-1-carboxylate synthase